MKTYTILILAIAALTGCTQLSVEDRALISSAHTSAEEAKSISAEALEEARKAREASERAAERADRIFREGQNK